MNSELKIKQLRGYIEESDKTIDDLEKNLSFEKANVSELEKKCEKYESRIKSSLDTLERVE
jgi:hypothetical protein